MSALAVYDCMLFLRAAARPERTLKTFRLIEDGSVVLCMSQEVLAEIRDVLARPEHRIKFPALIPQAIDAFLGKYLRLARWFADVPEQYRLLRDPKDSKYINLALASQSPYLVSTDSDLLDLMNHQTAEGQDFIGRFPSLRILDPIAFLAEVTHQAAP